MNSFIVDYPNYPASDATFHTSVQDTNEPLPVGTYLTWCVDVGTELNPIQGVGTAYSGVLFPTCDPNLNSELPTNHPPACYVSPAVWQQVNYILNHKNGFYFWDIQVAIYSLVGGPAPLSPPYPPFTPANVQSLLNDASNNAASWIPQCGNVIGAVYVITNQAGTTLTSPVQLVILEVPILCPTANCATINAVQGTPITPVTLVGSGGCGGPYTFTATGLPTGLSMSASGTISGTSMTSGTFNYSFTITDNCGNTGTNNCSVTVFTPPSASCMAISAVQGTAITPVTLTGTGGCGGPYTFNASGLPIFLTMSTAGVISGTPTTNGTFNYTVTIMDNCGNAGTFNCSVTVACNGQIGDFVWQDLNGNGCQDTNEPGIAGVNVSLYSGACGTTGTMIASTKTDSTGHYLFSGLCPGTYQVAITAPSGYTATTPNAGCTNPSLPPYSNQTDSKCNCGGASPCITCVTLTAVNPINLNVDCGYVLTPIPLTLSCQGGAGQVGQSLSSQLVVSGGIPAYSFAIIAGSLPPGVNLNPTTGQISGTPTGAGTFSFTAQVTDSMGATATSTCTSGCTASPCTTTWGFTMPTNCLGVSQTYVAGGLTITAYGYNSSSPTNKPTALYGKNAGGAETGLGICGAADNEITTANFVQLDLGDLIAKGAKNAKIFINSVQAGEQYNIYGSSTLGTLGTKLVTNSTVAGTFFPIPSYPNNQFISVQASVANVLLGAISVDCPAGCTFTIAPAPCTASVCGYVLSDCNGYGFLLSGLGSGVPNVAVTLKNASNITVATNQTDSQGAYCFYNLTQGTYTVSIAQPTNHVQKAGTCTKHWLNSSGQQCWVDNDNYQHWKNANGVDCWIAKDGYQHWKNSNNQDCWTDKYGNARTQKCTYVSSDVPTNNAETFTLAACQALTCVNFSYQGIAPKPVVWVTGPKKGICGQTATYTCTVSNAGTACFSTCQVTACGKTFNCPSLSPGESYSFPISYQFQWSDWGSFNCQATVSCKYSVSSTSCTAQATCSTSVSGFSWSNWSNWSYGSYGSDGSDGSD